MLILGKKRRLALASQALVASLLIAFGVANPLPAHAQGGLPTLGDGSDLTSSEERRLGDRIIRELYRDPDYIDDPVIGEYVQGIWQPLMAAARARGELSPELDERFAWEVLLGRDRTVNAFALPGGYLGLHSIALTRPVWLAFEGDRLRIVKAVEVHGQYLPQAQPGLTALPWTGPRLIAVGRWTNQTQHFWKVCSVLCRGILRRSTRNAGLLTSNAPKRCANCSILWPHWKIAPVWRLCGS